MYHPVAKGPTSIIDIHPDCILRRGSCQKVSGPPTTSRVNDYNFSFPRDEEGKVGVERGIYDTKNQPNKANFKYE